jgi:ribonuclease E
VSEDVAATPELDEVAAVPPAPALAPAADADAVPAAAWPVEAEQAAEAESVAMDAWASAEPVAAEPAAIEPRADAETRAASAAHRTADLLAKFRPGQSLDDELDAYEASVAPDPVAAEQAPVEPVAAESVIAEPDPVVAEADGAAEPELVAEVIAEAMAEPELVTDVLAEQEVVVADVAAAEPAAPPVEVEPQPEPVRADVVEQPTWRIVAPDTPTPVTNGHPPVPDPSQPAVAATAATPHAPEVEPQWPTSPEWPVAQPDPSLFARGRSSASAATDALWAASARDVIARPAGTPAGGVQPCGSCGLSLSATARFCRRCGSRQGA